MVSQIDQAPSFDRIDPDRAYPCEVLAILQMFKEPSGLNCRHSVFAAYFGGAGLLAFLFLGLGLVSTHSQLAADDVRNLEAYLRKDHLLTRFALWVASSSWLSSLWGMSPLPGMGSAGVQLLSGASVFSCSGLRLP
jgi:hypothetical protein